MSVPRTTDMNDPLYQAGYVHGWNACEATVVPRAERDAREQGARSAVPWWLVLVFALLLPGCSATRAHFENTASAVPPDYPDAGPSACTAKADITILSLFQSTQAQSQDEHANADGSIDTSSFAFGRSTDSAGLQTAVAGLGSLAGMLAKGAATGGVFLLQPGPDGTYRLVPVPQRQAAAPPPSQVSARGCIPAVDLPGGGVGPARPGRQLSSLDAPAGFAAAARDLRGPLPPGWKLTARWPDGSSWAVDGRGRRRVLEAGERG